MSPASIGLGRGAVWGGPLPPLRHRTDDCSGGAVGVVIRRGNEEKRKGGSGGKENTDDQDGWFYIEFIEPA